jgi:DNA-directed RNA polymerase specialized sigma24 family protein
MQNPLDLFEQHYPAVMDAARAYVRVLKLTPELQEHVLSFAAERIWRDARRFDGRGDAVVFLKSRVPYAIKSAVGEVARQKRLKGSRAQYARIHSGREVGELPPLINMGARTQWADRRPVMDGKIETVELEETVKRVLEEVGPEYAKLLDEHGGKGVSLKELAVRSRVTVGRMSQRYGAALAAARRALARMEHKRICLPKR